MCLYVKLKNIQATIVANMVTKVSGLRHKDGFAIYVFTGVFPLF